MNDTGVPSNGSARHVATEGVNRIKAGKRPTLPYQGITDPEEAFRVAVAVQGIYALGYNGEPTVIAPDLYEFVLPTTFEEVYLAIDGLAEDFLSYGSRVITSRGDADRTIDFHGVPVRIGNYTLQVVIAGITVRVNSRTSPLDATDQWRRAYMGLINTTVVGPENVGMTEEEERQYEQAREERKRSKQLQADRARDRMCDNANRLFRKLHDLPRTEISSPRLWKLLHRIAAKNTETGAANYSEPLEFAKYWARLMQAELAHGKELETAQQDTFAEVFAAFPPINQATADTIIDTLQQVWTYGDKLSDTFTHPLLAPSTVPKILMHE